MNVRKGLFWLVLVETLLCVFLTCLTIGVINTPQGTVDSAGHLLYRNSPVTRAHYWNAFSNVFSVRWNDGYGPLVLSSSVVYGMLLALCAVGVWLLSTDFRWRWWFTRWYFASQIVWLSGWLWADVKLSMRPHYMFRDLSSGVLGLIRGALDVESFTEGAAVWPVIYPIWCVTALGIGFYHWFTLRGSKTESPDGRRGRQPSQEER